MDRKELLELINEAKENKVLTLDLSHKNITELPPEIGQLINLTKLDLGDNQLKTLPSEIGQLTNLTLLYLHHNQLSTLPPEIGELTNLALLYLHHNQLKTFPLELLKLKNLGQLYLPNNQLSTLPPKIKQLKSLIKLDLQGNPLPIPQEVLGRVNEPSMIINYYLQHLGATAKQPLREAKVLIVGQGGVGKTQIVNRLLYNKYNENEPKTDGIDIHKWEVKSKTKKIKLNIWDFGGQEIMHATHQFFLTKRSLYLLVWDARQEDRYGQIDYWLKLIQSFGGDSPVIVVLNKIDSGSIDLDRRELMKKYSYIREFIRISCKTGQHLEQLKMSIIKEISQLPHIDDELLNSWFEIKTKLEKMAHDYIEYREYETMSVDRKLLPKSFSVTKISYL